MADSPGPKCRHEHHSSGCLCPDRVGRVGGWEPVARILQYYSRRTLEREEVGHRAKPLGGTKGAFLYGVDAISSTDRWAVGYYNDEAFVA